MNPYITVDNQQLTIITFILQSEHPLRTLFFFFFFGEQTGLIPLPGEPCSCNSVSHRDNNPLDCRGRQVLSFGLVDQSHAQVTEVKRHALQDGLACVRPVLGKLCGQKKLTRGGRLKPFYYLCATLYHLGQGCCCFKVNISPKKKTP